MWSNKIEWDSFVTENDEPSNNGFMSRNALCTVFGLDDNIQCNDIKEPQLSTHGDKASLVIPSSAYIVRAVRFGKYLQDYFPLTKGLSQEEIKLLTRELLQRCDSEKHMMEHSLLAGEASASDTQKTISTLRSNVFKNECERENPIKPTETKEYRKIKR